MWSATKGQGSRFRRPGSMTWKVACVLWAAMASGVAAAQEPGPPGGPTGSWSYGFSAGTGIGAYREDGRTTDLSAALGTPASLRLRGGRRVSPGLILGAELGYATSPASFSVLTERMELIAFGPALTWFPAGDGPYMRGRASLAWFRLRRSIPGWFTYRETSQLGAEAALGAGYAFRLGQTFHLTAGIDLAAQLFEGGIGRVSSANLGTLQVGCDWF